MDRDEIRERLAELQAENMPRATIRDLGIRVMPLLDGLEEGSREWVKAINVWAAEVAAFEKHLEGYLPSRTSCPACFAWGVEWGIVHGEARCVSCGWPATIYHFVKDGEGELLARVTATLYAHPSTLSMREGARL
jgi:hypothetical protein